MLPLPQNIYVALYLHFYLFGIGATIRIGQEFQCIPYVGFVF